MPAPKKILNPLSELYKDLQLFFEQQKCPKELDDILYSFNPRIYSDINLVLGQIERGRIHDVNTKFLEQAYDELKGKEQSISALNKQVEERTYFFESRRYCQTVLRDWGRCMSLLANIFLIKAFDRLAFIKTQSFASSESL
jgi:hypothetical protein